VDHRADAIPVEEAGDDLAACLFDSFDCFFGGARDGDVYLGCEALFALVVCEFFFCSTRRGKHTLAISFTPSFIPCRHRLSTSSLSVIGLVGSILPWSIQLCSRSRFSGDISFVNLAQASQRGAAVEGYGTVQIDFTLGRMGNP
jgi:hypothetical protein